MKDLCKAAVQAYLAHIQSGFRCTPGPGGRLCIISPYLHPDNDNIEIYLRIDPSGFVVSDLGETLRKLDTLGLDIASPGNFPQTVASIADGHGCLVQEGIVYCQGQGADFGPAMFKLFSALRQIGSLTLSIHPAEPTLFHEEVGSFLRYGGLQVERNAKLYGSSGKLYKIDFQINLPHAVKYIEAVSPRTQKGRINRIRAVFCQWSDLDSLIPSTRRVTLYNDAHQGLKTGDFKLLSRVSTVFRWSDRKKMLEFLKDPSAKP